MAKKKLARFAEMEVLPNVFQPKHEEVFRTDYPLKGKWNEEVFHNDHPIILEIGCGKGEYTVELGKLYPEQNFIGLDIKGARMWKGAKTAVENGMNNVAFPAYVCRNARIGFRSGRNCRTLDYLP